MFCVLCPSCLLGGSVGHPTVILKLGRVTHSGLNHPVPHSWLPSLENTILIELGWLIALE